MNKDELAAAVKSEQEERVQACAVALRQLLETYGCDLVPVPVLSADGRIVAEVQLRAK